MSMSHDIDFLGVVYKNEPQDLRKLLYTRLRSEWKYSHSKYFNNCFEKNVSIPVFMSKIINSFPYAMAQLIFYGVVLVKSMAHDVRKYEPPHRNPI